MSAPLSAQPDPVAPATTLDAPTDQRREWRQPRVTETPITVTSASFDNLGSDGGVYS